MLDAQQLNEFRRLYDYSRVLLEHYRNKTRNPERRLMVLGSARLALDELELRLVCQQLAKAENEKDGFADLPLHIFALRDLVCYIKHDVDHRLFVKLYGPQAENYLSTLLMILTTYLQDIGLASNERQPDWREEAYKLYKSYQTGLPLEALNLPGQSYLHQRYKDDETV
jgi:hypothetical protein